MKAPSSEETEETPRAFLDAFTAKDLRTSCRTYYINVRGKGDSLDNKQGYNDMLVILARSRRESEEAASDERAKTQPDIGNQLT
ncbi:hypothetical protein PF005_g5375 [Phytophthora fragariae]|uniref:Uncharacterized protein n=1 Tax=Phytophthora fragariae TaxID=53985 RepID=A0A6A3YVL5_9STRA|nr:hypothetical protein PF005_g5375 [Phytophthora fragariae]KAE9239457.1 hypothetical protein PF004_g7941 [Phytophthora fragariae]KAE9341941.1 hypothetical protein PF008_g10394 [Phytophthora fragariae]